MSKTNKPIPQHCQSCTDQKYCPGMELESEKRDTGKPIQACTCPLPKGEHHLATCPAINLGAPPVVSGDKDSWNLNIETCSGCGIAWKKIGKPVRILTEVKVKVELV